MVEARRVHHGGVQHEPAGPEDDDEVGVLVCAPVVGARLLVATPPELVHPVLEDVYDGVVPAYRFRPSLVHETVPWVVGEVDPTVATAGRSVREGET